MGEGAPGSAAARRTIVSETSTTAAVRTIVTQIIARIRRSIEFNCSSVKAGPSPWAATSSCRPILNVSPNVM
ncbi:MAG TPA: hypothetical protein VNF29_14545 [Candidatus Binataceae bacterium]|nr:hypothetical protein [Candidatus Binataceae bacterium]